MKAKEGTRRLDFGEDNDGREKDTSANAPDTVSDSTTWTSEQLCTARITYKAATAWRERNPRAYSIIERLALDAIRRGKVIGARYLCELTRYKSITIDEDGSDFRLNNNHAAVFARWIRSDHPEFADRIRIRRSALDEVMGDAE